MQGDAPADRPLNSYAVLYSYPTWDRHYRGQRGVRVEATDEADALERIRSGASGYRREPDARIVRIEEKAPSSRVEL